MLEGCVDLGGNRPRWHQGGAFYGQSIKPVHFGVGSAKVIDEIQLTWLSGAVEKYFNVAKI